jgi:hypothetical protein
VQTSEATLKAAELAGEDVDNKVRLEIIKQEDKIIKEEQKARQAEKLAEQTRVSARVSVGFAFSPPLYASARHSGEKTALSPP